MIRSLDELVDRARDLGPKRLAVAVADDDQVLAAAVESSKEGIADPVLVGDPDRIWQVALEHEIDLGALDILAEENPAEAALRAVELVRSGGCDFVMKGRMQTAEIMRAVLNKDRGLRTDRLMSLVSFFDLPGQSRVIAMSDGGVNIAPRLPEKVEITQNAIDTAIALGWECPRVAVLAALEYIHPDMPATADAACLAKMSERGQIKGGIVDGPLALDNAISQEAARHKGLKSPVAGRADVLIVPFIEVGNVLYKSLVYFSGASPATVLAGALAPVVITSRSDSHTAKVRSIALASIVSSRSTVAER